MSLVFDPVWPWSLVWEILVQIPPGPRAVAGLAMLAALLLPIFQLARAGRAILYTTITVLFMACLLVSQHAWTPILALARTSSSSGWTTWPMALVWQVVMILLLIGPPMLAGFSVGTYIGTPGVHFLRLASIALLRLLAFLFALCAVLRPALAIADREAVDSRLMILVDRSRSMTVQDELGKQSRWDLLRQTLTNAEPVLERLRENQQIAVQMFSFGDEVKEWTPGSPGEPDAKRTDFGGGLRSLFDRRDVQIPLRGVLVLSDGADNGSLPALAEAQRWRSSGATITTFASGNPGTAPQQNDVAITTISTAPTPFVPVKGKLTVKLNIDARGYENTRARVRLFMESEGQDKEVLGQDVVLPLSTGNEITLVTTAPAQPGEVKIKAVVETISRTRASLCLQRCRLLIPTWQFLRSREIICLRSVSIILIKVRIRMVCGDSEFRMKLPVISEQLILFHYPSVQ
ncbi:MAG: vWA domain-containing protein, partial [Gemmataceae bacterium]